MTVNKRIFESLVEKKEEQQMSRKIMLQINYKRDIWNSRRRFGY